MSANKRLSENSAMTNEQIIDLLEDVINQHCHYGTDMYNQCDKEPCQWCIEAKGAIEQLRTQQGGESRKDVDVVVALVQSATTRQEVVAIVDCMDAAFRAEKITMVPDDWPHLSRKINEIKDDLKEGIHPPAPAVPEGYVMVPVEPTEQMLLDALTEWDKQHGNGERNFMAMLGHCYKAMHKAAQGGE